MGSFSASLLATIPYRRRLQRLKPTRHLWAGLQTQYPHATKVITSNLVLAYPRALTLTSSNLSLNTTIAPAVGMDTQTCKCRVVRATLVYLLPAILSNQAVKTALRSTTRIYTLLTAHQA